MIQRKNIKVEGVRTKTTTADLLRNIHSVVLYVCVHLCVEDTLILNGWICVRIKNERVSEEYAVSGLRDDIRAFLRNHDVFDLLCGFRIKIPIQA